MLVAFYLAARLFMAAYLAVLAVLVPMVRGMMVLQVILTIIPSAIWISSIYIDMPNRLAAIWIAIFIDLCAAIGVIIVVRGAKFFSKRLAAWVDKVFEFYPAMNIEHKTERTNAFVTLVLGYSVVAIIYQNAASFGLNAFFGKAALGLVQAFCFNWLYFELDGADLYQHAIRRNAASGIFPFLCFPRSPTLTLFSRGLGNCPFTIRNVLYPRRFRPLKTRSHHRLPRRQHRSTLRVLCHEIRIRNPHGSALVLLRWSRDRFIHDGTYINLPHSQRRRRGPHLQETPHDQSLRCLYHILRTTNRKGVE